MSEHTNGRNGSTQTQGSSAVELREPHRAPAPALEASMSVAQLVARLDLISEVKARAMTVNVDYGVIPGTNKPSLYKPGAEKLAVLFKLDVQIAHEEVWLPGDHVTVIANATVFDASTAWRLGYGGGLCSTKETRYAQRKQERLCPTCGTPAVIKGKEEFGGGWLCWQKRDGCGTKFRDGDVAIEGQEVGKVANPDLADLWNTAIKMAKKRAFIDAVLTVTGASAIFTQDLEDRSGAAADPVIAGPPYGPGMPEELSASTGDAVMKLCGGDKDAGIVLWKAIRGSLEGYMPQAAAVALIAAAKATPYGGSDNEEASATPPTSPASTPAVSQSAPQGTEETSPPAESPPAAENGPPVGENGESSEKRFGKMVRDAARGQKLSDGQLANVLRTCGGGHPLEDEKAAEQLEEMLGRVPEEIAQKAVRHLTLMSGLDKLDPAAAAPEASVEVDFGALQPPQAA